MNCDSVKSKLTELVDNTLLPETKSRIEGHLQSCAGCRHLVSQYRKIWQMWDQPLDLKPPPDFWPDLIERIQASEGRRSPGRPFLSGYRYWLRPVAAAAFLFLGVLAGYHLGNFPAQAENGDAVRADSTEEQYIDDQMGMFYDFPEGSLLESYFSFEQNNG